MIPGKGVEESEPAAASALHPISIAGASPEAMADLMPAVYEELRRVAASYMRDERPHHTLQPTALVHEAYLRLFEQNQVRWQNRSHFLGMAARTMRRILTNYAIARTREKRGGKDVIRMTLDEGLDFYDQREISLPAVDEALRDLEALDPRQGRIVELRFFGGMTVEEIAALLEISPATVKREWATAKLWLRHEISARD